MPSLITPIIDTAIGIVVVYIAFSLLTSWLGEQVSLKMKWRSRMLVGAATQLLSGQAGVAGPASKRGTTSADVINPQSPTYDPAAAAFFSHPIFQSLKKSNAEDPQYASAQQFSSIILGLLQPAGPVAPPAGAPPAAFDFTPLVDAARRVNLPAGAAVADTEFSTQIGALAVKANGNYTTFVKAIEDWYDDHMDRVSGWYVKNMTLVLVIIGFVIAAMWNVDTLRLARALSCNAALRTSVSSLDLGEKGKPNSALIKTVIDAVPLGWDWSSKDNTPPERTLSCDAVEAQSAAAPAAAAVKKADDDKTKADAEAARTQKAFTTYDTYARQHLKDRHAADKARAAAGSRDAAKAAAIKASDAKAAADKAANPSPAGPREWNDWIWFWILKFFGLLATAIALSQGAGFWFDTLSSLTRVREAGKKPDPSKDASRS